VATKPRRVAVLQTAGWRIADPSAIAAFEDAVARIAGAGIEVASRSTHPAVEAAEQIIADAQAASVAIVGYETRWPLNTYRAKDPSKLSRFMLDRLAHSETLTLEDYRTLLADREHARAIYARLEADFDLTIMLAAPGIAPMGIDSTGDTVFNTPSSLLGVPALNLPVLSVDGMPLGLQTMGFINHDSGLFASSAWLQALLRNKD
jgi:Asp-tRNA(Asn)/Glu-tRNA(Gln) amidotransferase A subunit family amidase